MQGFYFLVKFGLALIYILKAYRKKALRFCWKKICWINRLHFPLETHVPSQVFKDFSVENLETTTNTFFSNFSSEIYYLELLIIGVVFSNYT